MSLIVPKKYDLYDPLNIYRDILELNTLEHIMAMEFPWTTNREFRTYIGD